MANTLTNLVPDIYEAIDVVSRELSGFIPAVTLDANAARAAVGQAVRVPIAPASTAADITPGTNPPDTGDQTFGNTSITITKARAVPFRWTGEEQRGVNSGVGYQNLRRDQIAQAIRTLVNEVEADLAANYVSSSRAFGTAGTTMSSIDNIAEVRKILADNGCPMNDIQLVLDTTSGTALRKIGNLYKVNESGDTSLLRQGILSDLHGFSIRESAFVKLHTPGTAASYLVNNAAAAIGDTSLAIDTGTGTHVAGDTITIAGSTDKYVVGTGSASSGAKTIVLNQPGLRFAHADNAAVTQGAAYRANMAFHRSAMILAARAPALPEEGDMAVDRMLVTDPRTGLTFEVSMYLQYRRVRYEVALAWGTANIKSAHTATLLG